jgi:hypothetical protein
MKKLIKQTLGVLLALSILALVAYPRIWQFFYAPHYTEVMMFKTFWLHYLLTIFIIAFSALIIEKYKLL